VALSASDERSVRKLAVEADDQFDRLVAEAISANAPVIVPRSREFSAAALAEVSSYIRERLISEWRQMILHAEISQEDAEYLEMRLDRIVSRPAHTDEMTELLNGSPRDRAAEINASWGFGLDENSSEFAELVRAVKDGCVTGRRGVQDLFEGKSLPDEPTSTLIKRFGTKARRSTKRFSELATEHRKTGSFAQSTRVKMERAHDLFLKTVGDKPIGDITRDDVRSFLDTLSRQKVAGKAITRETMQSYLTQISSPLSWAIERGWMQEPNPAKGFKLNHWASSANPIERRRRFTVGELNSLFAHPWFGGCEGPSDIACHKPGPHLLSDMRYWAPVVALYTGARAAELAGLKLTEIKLDDAHPHILIQANEYRGIKSGVDRHVPILDALLSLGFADYIARVKATGSNRLFPDWEKPKSGKWASAKWIKSFNRTVIPAVFTEAAKRGHKSPLVFHSFRGAFKMLLLNAGKRHLANAIIGHVQDELDKSYLGQMTPVETYAEFRAVDFVGLKVPSRLIVRSRAAA
jgi:integrase